VCGISLPCGFDDNGLPVGLQIIGPAFGEERILHVGHAYQRVTDWHTSAPEL
jgi:aspartyl-tRNA(Asn)/glutamyl-tRNA(Gln) amidotransferase subunit A